MVQGGLSRDRDPAGRPRNARARDAAGRPLPRGAPGERPEELPPLPPAEALDLADSLLAAHRPFTAHEVLESAWKADTGAGRDLWRGLAQLAVALTHRQRGNAAGATALFLRAAETLQPWAGRHPHGVAVDELRAFCTAAASDQSRLPPLPPLRAAAVRPPRSEPGR